MRAKRTKRVPGADGTSDAVIARLIGKQKHVLDVTRAESDLAAAVAKNDCTVFEMREADADKARPPKVLAQQGPFDVIVLRDGLKYVPQPTHALATLVDALAPDGFMLAVVPNALHGAIVLALLSGDLNVESLGIADDTYLSFLTPDTIGDLFLAVGLHVERVERVRLGVFESSPLLPRLSRGELDQRLIAEIEGAPESDTVQLVVKARPLNAYDKHRAIVQRLHETLKQSSDARRSAASRTGEASRLRSTIAAIRSLLDQYPAVAASNGEASLADGDDLRSILAKAAERAASERSNAALASQLESAIVRNEHLSERAEETERRLEDLLRSLIVSTQSENARLALLIDTVQSSHFWRIKRAIGKLLGRGGA